MDIEQASPFAAGRHNKAPQLLSQCNKGHVSTWTMKSFILYA